MARRKRAELEEEEAAIADSPSKKARQSQVLDDDTGVNPVKKKRGRPRTVDRETHLADNRKSVYDIPDSDEERVGQEHASAGASPSKPKGTTTPRKDKRLQLAVGVSAKSTNGTSATPQKRKSVVSAATPSKSKSLISGVTPQWRRNDRSARKKSARALIEQVVAGTASDEDDQDIAREIYESSEDEDEEDIQDEQGVQSTEELAATTPSKRPRGRPRKDTTKAARKKSPTPPRDLPPHELYFAQNRPGTAKTSGNTLSNLKLLTHEEYFSILKDYKDPHAEDIDFLQGWHADSFPQWQFELSQGFSICAYGYGSKRPLLHMFAKHLHSTFTDHQASKIVIINGYVRNTSIREMLGTVGSAVDPAYRPPAGNPSAMLEDMKRLLSSHAVKITIILNSIDAVPLRRSSTQSILAQLASHPNVQLICSADTPDFSLLWDGGVRSAFNFVFHDCTTFAPFTAEIDVVDEVHEMLGRKARRIGGKEGVTYVLRSLPENAKNLFRLLVCEVLVAMDEEGMSAGENPGVEYRMLYNKAVEEFICSSEMAFRTLLKEFHDHQMITSRKDVIGTELLSVPFRKEEIEAILEDLMA